MEKAYDFDIPEDISEIPAEHPDEIEGKDQDEDQGKSFSLRIGS
jgi:hypothetical protein